MTVGASRDVIGHMCVGHTEPLLSVLAQLPKYRFNVDAGSAALSARFADEHTPDELLALFSGIAADHTRQGFSRLIPVKAGFTDHLVHQQDIRRPLGAPREIAEDRKLAALDALTGSLGGSMPAKKHLQGLKVTATDVEWTHGEGPEVRGPAEAIVLAALGRDVALADLEGDGLSRLEAAIAA